MCHTVTKNLVIVKGNCGCQVDASDVDVNKKWMPDLSGCHSHPSDVDVNEKWIPDLPR